MRHIMAKFWWILVIRGGLGLLLGSASIIWIWNLSQSSVDLFGMSLFFRPAAIIATLVLLLGTYAFLDGFFALFLGAQDYGDGRRWGFLIAEGVLSLGMGVLCWARPGTLLVLIYWIAAWSALTGILEIMQANELNEYRDRRPVFFTAGLISIAFGVAVSFFHQNGTVLVWLMAAYAFLFGLPLLGMGLHLRPFAHKS